MRRVVIESPLLPLGDGVPTIPGKRCSKCRAFKPIANFVLDKNRKDGRSPQCEACVQAYRREWLRKPKVIERNKIYQREFARGTVRKQQIKEYQLTVSDNGITKRSSMKLKYKYGITENHFINMLEAQNGRCATCLDRFVTPTSAQIDHCHISGLIRGLLCANCNRALGMVGDDIDVLRRMIAYLGRPRCAS